MSVKVRLVDAPTQLFSVWVGDVCVAMLRHVRGYWVAENLVSGLIVIGGGKSRHHVAQLAAGMSR